MGNKAYSLWRVNGCQQGFRSVAGFGFSGQESASKPRTAVCKPLYNIEIKINNETNIIEKSNFSNEVMCVVIFFIIYIVFMFIQ